MAANDPILEARGIHAWYGSSHVLHGIDLQIGRGETIADTARVLSRFGPKLPRMVEAAAREELREVEAAALPLLLLAAWQLWAFTLPADTRAPYPSKVLSTFWTLTASGDLPSALMQSLGRVLAGFTFALLLGGGLGAMADDAVARIEPAGGVVRAGVDDRAMLTACGINVPLVAITAPSVSSVSVCSPKRIVKS